MTTPVNRRLTPYECRLWSNTAFDRERPVWHCSGTVLKHYACYRAIPGQVRKIFRSASARFIGG
ncbi:MAG: hypothetical protein MI923_09745 [Phycisphaerales bacterium]|nr:hypothetical protein [Phycisphaerales bacterium]